MTGRTTGPAAVVTGIGTFSSLGRGAADTFDALCHGKSGLVRPMRRGTSSTEAWMW